MDSFFNSLFIILISEIVISSFWLSIYYRIGIPVYKKEIICNENINTEKMQNSLKNTFEGSSLVFHKLSDNEIAFREKMFRLFSRNQQLMHGIIIYKNNKIVIRGFLNWFPTAFFAFFYFSFIHFRFHSGFDFFLPFLPIAILGIMYLYQSRKYDDVVIHLLFFTKQAEGK